MSAENGTTGATVSQTNETAAPEPAAAVSTEFRKSPASKRVQNKVTATASASDVKKPKKVVVKAKIAQIAPGAHSTYIEMIKSAISELKEKTGSSRAAILKHITQHNQVGDNAKLVNAHLRQALKRGVSTGALKQTKGVGASGSFRIGDNPTATKTKVSPKKAAQGSPKKVISKPVAASTTSSAPVANPKKDALKKPVVAPKSTAPAKKPIISKNGANAKVAAAAAPAAVVSSTSSLAKPKKAATAAAASPKKNPLTKKKSVTKTAVAKAAGKTKGSPIAKKKTSATASKKKNGGA